MRPTPSLQRDSPRATPGESRFSPLVSITLLLLAATNSALGADYYVSATGNDGASGTTPGTAWQSISRVIALDIEPGDRILFEGGSTFSGTLNLDETDTGTPGSPVNITSYGTGRATIDGGTANGINVTDCAGISIHDINVVGSGTATNTGHGIRFETLKTDGSKFDHIRINQVDVSGFREAGITITSDHSSLPGFRDVRITNVRAFDNGEKGIGVSGYFQSFVPRLSHEDIYIGYTEVFDNFGDPTNISGHTGSGIIVSATDGAVIEYCLAYNNGGIGSMGSGGPVGIWAWQANDVAIQHNIAHNNRTGGGADGGGFDLDGGVTNSVMQYNYSYENEGAGYLLAQFFTAPAFSNNVVRYNISYNDGRRNGYGGVLMFTDFLRTMDDVEIYGNTIYVSPAATGRPAAVRAFNGTYGNVNFRNNIFITEPGVELIRSSVPLVPGEVTFQGNVYWTTDGSFEVEANGTTYTSLADFRSTGQEMLGPTPLGLHIDPMLVAPGNPQLLTDPTELDSLAAYQALPGSPVIGAGLDLLTLFGIDPGPRDFYGTVIPQGTALNIGAAQSGDPVCPAGENCCFQGPGHVTDPTCYSAVPVMPRFALLLLVLSMVLCAAPTYAPRRWRAPR